MLVGKTKLNRGEKAYLDRGRRGRREEKGGKGEGERCWVAARRDTSMARAERGKKGEEKEVASGF